MPGYRLGHRPSRPSKKELQHAYQIISRTHDSADSFLSIFPKLREKPDAPTDEEQDLLRAMLLFAASGLDAMVKQFLRDALPHVLKKNKNANLVFEHRAQQLIPKGELTKDKNLLREIFEGRDQIAHKMDVDFYQHGRKRRQRRREEMIKYTEHLFQIAGRFLAKVEKKM